MINWLQKFFNKKDEPKPLEDFVLYSDADSVDTPAEDVEVEVATEVKEESTETSFSDTDRLEIPPELLRPSFFRSHKKLILSIGIPVVALLLVVALILTIPVLTDPLRGYAQASVSRGNVISSLNVSGTLSANAHYSITSLVSGTVIDAPLEVGDQVEVGTVLYQLDDTDAQLALKRAENQLEKSRDVGNYDSTPLRIYAAESGVIQSLAIRSGYTVSAGQVIGTLRRSDDAVVSITSAVSGTVSSVNVSPGVSVVAGSLIATVQDNQNEANLRSSEYDQKSSEYDVEAAQNQLKNYTIVSPISGVITEKNAKIGDNVAITNTKQPMMVITDTASMRFTFQVEESRLSEVKPGLRASVTTDSIPNKTFTGSIKSVFPEGTRNKEGKLMFDVEVLVENPGALKSGMNVSAKIILATASNALHIPAKALRSPDGKTALVLVKISSKTSSKSVSGKKAKEAKIEIPEGCRLISVQYGVSDGNNVQILSGLKKGETVVYSPDWEVLNLKTVATPITSDTTTRDNTDNNTDIFELFGDVEEEENADSNEALRQEILDRVRENQANAAAQQNTEI